jgi:hypothetical protein
MTAPDPQLAAAFAITSAVGLLMTVSGVHKSLLEWRRRRVCPGCGRPFDRGRCGCNS